MKTAKAIGNLGENIAENYLKKRGWRIISRNFSGRGGEIDIIGYRFGVLCYFEVKARSGENFGKPAEAVDSEKVSRIIQTANAFNSIYRVGNKIPVFYPFGKRILRTVRKERIDIIEVFLIHGEKLRGINHIKDINL